MRASTDATGSAQEWPRSPSARSSATGEPTTSVSAPLHQDEADRGRGEPGRRPAIVPARHTSAAVPHAHSDLRLPLITFVSYHQHESATTVSGQVVENPAGH